MQLIRIPALSKLRLKIFYRIGFWSVQIWKLNGHIFKLEPFTEVGKFCSGEKFNFFFFLSNQNSNFISRKETELWRIFHLIGMLEWVCQIFRWRNFFPIFGRKKTESRQGHIAERLWVRSPGSCWSVRWTATLSGVHALDRLVAGCSWHMNGLNKPQAVSGYH